jgi:hypothetical protein
MAPLRHPPSRRSQHLTKDGRVERHDNVSGNITECQWRRIS